MQRTDHVPEAGRSGGSGEPRGTGSFDLGTGYDRDSADPEAAREFGDTAATGTPAADTQQAAVPAPRDGDDTAADADRDTEQARTGNVLPGETPPGESSAEQARAGETSTDQTRTDETSTDEARADEAGADEAGAVEARADEAGTDQASTDDARTDDARTDDARSDEERSGVHRAPGSDDSRLFTGTQSTDFRGRWR
ncbi:MAG: hypothetical protein QOJ50_3543, partial [Cryptosporangiaceae bacterium]|nr:hypothetical protein [Cryptosporangiaceae bacterium]